MHKLPALRCFAAPWLDPVQVTGMPPSCPCPYPCTSAGRCLLSVYSNHSQRCERPPACSESEAASWCNFLTFRM